MFTKQHYRVMIALVVAFGIFFSIILVDESRNRGPGSLEESPLEEPDTSQMDGEFVDNQDGPVFGYFVMAHEVRTFVECGSVPSTALWVDDQTGRLTQLYQAVAPKNEPYASVFGSVVMRRESRTNEGFGADYEQTGVVSAINYWPFEGFDCDYPWGKFNLRAFGNEPFWVLEISHSELTLSRPDFPKQTWLMDLNQVPLRSVDGNVLLELTEKPCQDGMSGNWFGWTVSVTYEGHVLNGCGMKGVGA